MAVDWRELSGLGSAELQRVLLAELDSMMGGLSDREADEQLARLPLPLRVMWLLSWLDFEVTQGSFLAYFFNSHGRHAALAEQALRDIGAVRMADVLLHARQSVDAASNEWVARHEEIDRRGPHAVVRPYEGLSNAETLAELTDRYWAAADQESWGDKLDAFLSTAAKVEARKDHP